MGPTDTGVVVSEQHDRALLGEAALFFRGFECNSPAAPSGVNRLIYTGILPCSDRLIGKQTPTALLRPPCGETPTALLWPPYEETPTISIDKGTP